MKILNRTLRTLFSVLLGSILAAGSVHAQSANPANALERLQGVRSQLGLSQEQFSEIEPLLEEETTKLKTLKDETSLSDPEKRLKAREISSEIREKIGMLLTPEQREKAAELMRSRAATTSGDEAKKDATGRLQAMKEKLALSDAQMEKLKPILAEEAPKLRALKEDKDSSEEQRRQLFKQSMEKIAAELTPEQREKMRDQMKPRQK